MKSLKKFSFPVMKDSIVTAGSASFSSFFKDSFVLLPFSMAKDCKKAQTLPCTEIVEHLLVVPQEATSRTK